MNPCILIPSHVGYRSLAIFTASQIDRCWKDHPPIFFCGLDQLKQKDGVSLLRHRDSVNWIGIALDAVREVRQRGFEVVYLILDDHPPMGLCRDDILNYVLPEILQRLGADNISLFGSGQGRGIEGRVFRESSIGIERLPESYLWRYSLHPGLWSCKSLQDLLELLDSEILTDDSRSPWAFERVGGKRTAGESEKVLTQCYRLASPVPMASQVERTVGSLYRLFGGIARSVAGAIGGPKAWNRVSQQFDFVHHFFGGPYPILWRGVMEKGRLNPAFQSHGRYFFKRDLLAVAASLSVNNVVSSLEKK
jgi:hypothetical protein